MVSLGKQLSRRWYVGYERSLNATAGTLAADLPHRPALHAARPVRRGQFAGRDLDLALALRPRADARIAPPAVVQWIERPPPKRQIQVRFLSVGPGTSATGPMDRRNSPSDICDKFIRPAMESAGWDSMVQIFREYSLRAGRVVVRGRKAKRDETTVLRADYARSSQGQHPVGGRRGQGQQPRHGRRIWLRPSTTRGCWKCPSASPATGTASSSATPRSPTACSSGT